jgi:lysophospholipase L1-like esterase
MWSTSVVIAGILIAALNSAAASESWSVRPQQRPDRVLLDLAQIRPQPRPKPDLTVPSIIRPVPRPDREAVLRPGAPMTFRPKPRPASLTIQIAMPKPEHVPPPRHARPAPPAAMPYDVVMIGDSITAGGHWDRQFPGVRIANRGISGDTALKILARMDEVLKTHPKRALLMFGINDVYNGVPVERIERRYDRIVALLRAQSIDVVIQSTLACSGSSCGRKLAKVQELNAKLRVLARNRRVKYVDINREMSNRDGLKRIYSSDGVHLNGDGYAKWYAILQRHIEQG